MTVIPYAEIATLPLLYELPKNTEIFIGEDEYLVDHMRDYIKTDGSITRLIRVRLR